VLRERGIAAMPIGRTGGDALVVNGRPVSLEDLRRAHEDFFPNLMGGELTVA